jgi:hypothetical protein
MSLIAQLISYASLNISPIRTPIIKGGDRKLQPLQF